jgi:nucleotide-binding universal stress UspA family protein
MAVKPLKITANKPSREQKGEPSGKRHKPSSKGIILVPVDFYPHSEAAVEFAANMAHLMNANLLVVHVVHDPVDVPGFYLHEEKKERKLRRMEEVAKDMLTKFMKKMASKHPDIPTIKKAETKLVVGIPVTRILEIVKITQPRCVVMGSQGRTGLAQFFVGSTAENIVHLCPVPITIVKSKHFLDKT